MSASCLYQGMLTHRRVEPDRQFRHRVAMAYIDLDELPRLLGGRLLHRSPGLLRFRRADYHGERGTDLASSVRDTVERELGERPSGPIRLLTNLRSFGHCFNPVSFYYCFGEDGERLEAVLAEVTNTPWGERHAYVMASGAGSSPKHMHVSPFMPMDQTYAFSAAAPAARLSVTISNRRSERLEFAASLLLERVELTPAAVRRISCRYPLATVRNLVLIYGHALGLRLAGVRSHPHPHPQGGST